MSAGESYLSGHTITEWLPEREQNPRVVCGPAGALCVRPRLLRLKNRDEGEPSIVLSLARGP